MLFNLNIYTVSFKNIRYLVYKYTLFTINFYVFNGIFMAKTSKKTYNANNSSFSIWRETSNGRLVSVDSGGF